VKKAGETKGIKKPGRTHTPAPPVTPVATQGNNVGLTVRIEINLPAGGDKETYDTIFKSIRENLLNVDNA
jgi:hypothetical protein